MGVRLGSKGREEKLKGTRCNVVFCFVLFGRALEGQVKWI